MTEKGKWVPLLAVFELENRASSGANNLLLKRAFEMKLDFFFFALKSKSLFIALGSCGTLFFPRVSLLLLSLLLSLSLSYGVHQRPNIMDSLINNIVQRHSTSVLIVRRLFAHMLSHASCHLSEKQTCLCYAKMFKEDEKYVFAYRKIQLDLGRCKAEETMSSLGSLSLRCSCFEFEQHWEPVKSEIWIVANCPWLLLLCLLV